jgi:hypothetical protein
LCAVATARPLFGAAAIATMLVGLAGVVAAARLARAPAPHAG